MADKVISGMKSVNSIAGVCSLSGSCHRCFRQRFFQFSFLFLLGLFWTVSASAQTLSSNTSLEVVNLQLRWKHQFQFAGYYAALENGYYRDAGLDVRIHEGEPGRAPVDEVIAGRAEYGTANSEVLLARLKGTPLVALAVIFQHSPSVLLARADSGIRTPHDLVGRSVMFMGGQHDTDFHAMFRREGIRPESIDIRPSSDEIDDLVSGKVDAFNAYLTNEPFVLRQRGVEFVVINPSHYGVDYYGGILFTTEREIGERPDRVKAFREASLRGWQYAMEHPEVVVELLLNKYRVPKTRDHLEFEAATARSLILPELVEIGHMNPERWRAMADALKSCGLVDDDTLLEGFIYDPDPRVWEKRWRNIVISMGLVIGTILVVMAYLFRMQRRLRNEIDLRRQIEEQLLGANNLLQRTGRLAKVGGFERNIANNTTIYTEEAARIREVAPGVEIPFDQTMGHYVPEERPLRIAENERAIREGIPWEHESLLTMPSGKQTWVYVRGEPVFRDGKVVKLVGATQDITDRKLAELALVGRSRELEMHNSILRQIHQGVALSDVLDSLASQAEMLHPGMLCAVLLFDAGNNRLRHVAAPGLPSQFIRVLDDMLANDEASSSSYAASSGKRVIVENMGRSPERSMMYCRHAVAAGFQSCWSQPIKGRENRVLGVFVIYQRTPARPGDDEIRLLENFANLAALVVEHYQTEEKIRNLAFFDALTQLPNRRMLFDRLRQAMANSRRSGCYGALLFLDLDNFKPLNDTFGHHAGDLLLIQVAQRISSCVRETDTVARFGGDEFVVMLGELDANRDASEAQVRGIAEKIRSILAEPFVVCFERDDASRLIIEHCCTASIGVVLFINHEASVEEIIKWADHAMYQAKNTGRNNVCFHS